MKHHLFRFGGRAVTAVLMLCLLLLTACDQGRTQTDTSTAIDSVPVPSVSEETAPIAEPVFPLYPFSFYIDDGSEITVELPCDPAQDAELHACTLADGSDALYHVILYRAPSDAAASAEEARVFSYADGTEYPVVPVSEILARYVTLTAEDAVWRLHVNGADYEIPKAQFSEELQAGLADVPRTDLHQEFYVERGQLFCRVSFFCGTAAEDGDPAYLAAETLRIRYGLDGTQVTAAEISFERQEAAAEETDITEETP